MGELHGIVNTFNAVTEPMEQAILNSLDEYAQEKTHGANHSFDVYTGMRYLARQDGKLDPKEDSKYQAMAVLHDMAQFLPFNNPYTGEAFAGNKRKLHARIMSVAIRWFGERLHLDQNDRRELSQAINVHDDYYAGVHHKNLPYAAQLLSDADKLFGAGMETDPRLLARDAIKRNLAGCGGAAGWYCIRPELTRKQRSQWRYGDRWNLDAFSAVCADMYNPVGFYTEAAQKLGLARTRAFEELMDQEYGNVYDAHMRMVHQWREALEKNTSKVFMRLVAKNPADPKNPQTAPIRANKYIQDPTQLVKRVVESAYEKELMLNPAETKPGFEARGWKVEVAIGPDTFLIDPSIARFATKDAFLAALHGAIATE